MVLLNVGTPLQVLPHEIYKVEKSEVSSNMGINISENNEQSSEGANVPDNQFLELSEKVILSLQVI